MNRTHAHPSHSRPVQLLAVCTLLASGCDTSSPAAPEPVSVESAPTLRAPLLTRADLTPSRTVVHGTDPVGADGADPAGPAMTDGVTRPLQQITGARTGTGFGSGYAFAVGQHFYTGNVGAISTTANVTFGDKHVGSHTSDRQDYTPFLIDFGQTKYIVQSARVYTSRECGLTVDGSSKHRAWWQFFQGQSVAAWGTALQSTQGRPTHQGACASSGGTGTGTSSETTSSGLVCTYYITFDLGTGRILNAELLSCSSVTGTDDWI